MYKLSTILSLMVALAFLAGCSAIAAPDVKASAPIIPVTSSSQIGLRAGSGENMVPPAEVYFYSPDQAYFNLGSGENVVRPAEPYISSPVTASFNASSGENVVPPPDTMTYKALHPSNP